MPILSYVPTKVQLANSMLCISEKGFVTIFMIFKDIDHLINLTDASLCENKNILSSFDEVKYQFFRSSFHFLLNDFFTTSC